jgi:hypothetical protein
MTVIALAMGVDRFTARLEVFDDLFREIDFLAMIDLVVLQWMRFGVVMELKGYSGIP